jgi:hypothetical protein
MDISRQEGGYNVYQATLENYINVEPGACQVYFLIIQDNKIKSSKIEKINLAYDNFSAANKLFLMDSMTKEVQNICTKIEKYTELNIQLYKDIREAKGLND